MFKIYILPENREPSWHKVTFLVLNGAESVVWSSLGTWDRFYWLGHFKTQKSSCKKKSSNLNNQGYKSHGPPRPWVREPPTSMSAQTPQFLPVCHNR